jgi:hypothetical protein
MKEFDINWHLLRKEQANTVEAETTPATYSNGERWQVRSYFNNSKNYKISWREGILNKEAWFDYKEHKGLWRSTENRLWEEIVYIYRLQSGISVTRQTARTPNYENLMNIKMIEVLEFGRPLESFLIIDGNMLLKADPIITKNYYTYNYRL